jgi:hypothetical protein
VLDRARAKLATWKGKLMNAGGRRALTRSVLDSLSIYALTALRLPKKFTKSFDQIRRRFTWDMEETGVAGGKCKVSWQIVCSPTDVGGLGLLHLEAFARALRLRWLWLKWTCPGRPWASLGTPCDQQDLNLFASATCVTIGNGKTASFWQSNWLGGTALCVRFPSLFRFSARKQRSVAEALALDRWVLDLRRAPIAAIATDFIVLWREINNTGIALVDSCPDSISWILSPNGVYTAKSAYRVQFEGRQLSLLPSLVWDAWAPAKCKLFAWLLLQNKLWCSDRLMRRAWPNCYFCPLCIRHLETAQHLFLDCPFARLLWASVASWMHCSGLAPRVWSNETSMQGTWSAMIQATEETHRGGVQSIIILVNWALWKERNNRVFKDKPSSLRRLLQLIQEEAKEWTYAGAKKLRRMLWEPP